MRMSDRQHLCKKLGNIKLSLKKQGALKTFSFGKVPLLAFQKPRYTISDSFRSVLIFVSDRVGVSQNMAKISPNISNLAKLPKISPKIAQHWSWKRFCLKFDYDKKFTNISECWLCLATRAIVAPRSSSQRISLSIQVWNAKTKKIALSVFEDIC